MVAKPASAATLHWTALRRAPLRLGVWARGLGQLAAACLYINYYIVVALRTCENTLY